MQEFGWPQMLIVLLLEIVAILGMMLLIWTPFWLKNWHEDSCGGFRHPLQEHQWVDVMENGLPAVNSDHQWIHQCTKCGKRKCCGMSSRGGGW